MISMSLRKIIILIYLVLDLNYQLCDSKYISGCNGINNNFFSSDKNSHYSCDLSSDNGCEESILKRAINKRMLTEEEQKQEFRKWTPSPFFSHTASEQGYKSPRVHYTQINDYEFSTHKKRNCKRNNKSKGLKQRRYSQDFRVIPRGRRAHRSRNQFRLKRNRKHIFNSLKKPNEIMNTNDLSLLYKNSYNASEVKIKNDLLYHTQIVQEPCSEVNTNHASSISDCFNKKKRVISQDTHGFINAKSIAAKTEQNSSILNNYANSSSILSKCKSSELPSDDFDTLQSFLLQMYKSHGDCACKKNGNPMMFGYTASPMTIKRLQNYTHYPFYHQKYIQSLLSDNKLISNTSCGPYNVSYPLPNGGSKNRNREFSKFIDETSIFETPAINSLNNDDLASIEPILNLADISSCPKNFSLVLAFVPYPETRTCAISSRATTTTMEPLKYLYAGKTTRKPKVCSTEPTLKKQEAPLVITILIPASMVPPITTPCPGPTKPNPALTPSVTTSPAPVTVATTAVPAPIACTGVAPPTSKPYKDMKTIVDELMFNPPSVPRGKKTKTYYCTQQTTTNTCSLSQYSPSKCCTTPYPSTKYIYGGELDTKIFRIFYNNDSKKLMP